MKEGPSDWVRPEASGISFSSSHSGGWGRIAPTGHRNLPLFPAGGEMPQILPFSCPSSILAQPLPFPGLEGPQESPCLQDLQAIGLSSVLRPASCPLYRSGVNRLERVEHKPDHRSPLLSRAVALNSQGSHWHLQKDLRTHSGFSPSDQLWLHTVM